MSGGSSSCKEEWTEKKNVCVWGGGPRQGKLKKILKRDAPSCCPSMLGIEACEEAGDLWGTGQQLSKVMLGHRLVLCYSSCLSLQATHGPMPTGSPRSA